MLHWVVVGDCKVALVTGGSRGIGAAVAKRLAAAGMQVHIAYQSRDSEANQVRDEIAAAGGKAWIHRADVSDESAVRALVSAILDAHDDALHVLVNNAGVIDDRLLAGTPLESWNRVLAVNLTSAFLLTREVLPVMLDQRWGRIINISSNSVRTPGPGQAAYAASKGGLEALTRATAAEVGHKGIRVNTVAPGAVETEMTSTVRERLVVDEARHRWGTPDDIAGTVAFLASDDADYIQGQTLVLDGGRSVARPKKGT